MDAPGHWITILSSFTLIVIDNKETLYRLLIELGFEVIRYKDMAHTSKDLEVA